MRQPAGGPAPLFVFDAGYDPVPLTEGLAATRAAILVRLRRDRCFYADPTSQPPTTTRKTTVPPRSGRA